MLSQSVAPTGAAQHQLVEQMQWLATLCISFSELSDYVTIPTDTPKPCQPVLGFLYALSKLWWLTSGIIDSEVAAFNELLLIAKVRV